MDKHFIIFIFLIIYLISNIQSLNFTLTNGISKRYTSSLEDGEAHYFFVETKPFQNVTYYIYVDYISTSVVQSLYALEFSDKNSDQPNKEIELDILNIYKGGGGHIEYSSYIVSLPNTNYIAFKLLTKKKISYFETQIDCTNGIYDLKSGESKKITNVLSKDTYIFYIPAYEKQNINIFLTTNEIGSQPFESVKIYEYEYRDNSFHSKYKSIISPISSVKSNQQLILSYEYRVSIDNTYVYSQTNYLALRIVTNDIKYFIVKINNPIEYYDLNNGVQKTFYNLKSNTTYIFYGKGIQYQYAKIFFETNSLNDKSLDKVIFYELRNKTYNYYNEKGEIPISFKSSYNQLSTSASYEIENYYTKLISFRINPLYDIDELNVKINIQGFSYTLSENKEKSISSVISGEQYTFLMRSNLYDLVNITVTTNYIDSKPFTKFIIFESVSQSASFIKNQSLSLTSYKQDNQLVSTTSYLNSYDVAYLLTLKIIPNNGIKYFNIKFNIDKTLFSKKYAKNATNSIFKRWQGLLCTNGSIKCKKIRNYFNNEL